MNVIELPQNKIETSEITIINDYAEPVKKRSTAASPIKDIDLIATVSEAFISKGKLRNNLLFILGCNCGLRCGELLSLKWGQLLDPEGNIRKKIEFVEEKNSKKDDFGNLIRERTHTREVYINKAVQEAIRMYLETKGVVHLDSYVFTSESRSAAYYTERRKQGIGLKQDHLTIQSVNQILKKMFKETLEIIDLNISTHSLRKTFARQVLENCPPGHYHDTLRFLQMMLGHARIESTLHYVGITSEEIENTFMDLNLGKKRSNSGSKLSADVINLQDYQNIVKTEVGK